MKARAPGKVVLSGAYAVLEGAPALVAAVDRYVIADSERAATMVTAEVAAAMRLGALEQAVWFDAAPLRREVEEAGPAVGSGKLGLGSSAAILVASLAATMLARGVMDAELGAAAFSAALAAHRAAQPGGSGIDVAASCFGGVLCCRLTPPSPTLAMQPHELPAELVLEVWRCAAEASTQAMLGRVSALRGSDRDRYRALIEPAARASREVAAVRSAEGWIAGLDRQIRALAALGDAAGAAIVPSELEELGALARAQGACFGPAGAGGGDIALWAGLGLPPAHFRARAAALGLCPLPLRFGAAGVHRLPDTTLAAPDRPLAPT